jgi:hypothetical protein
MTKAFHVFDPREYRMTNLPAYLLFDHQHLAKYGFLTHRDGEPTPSWLTEASNLEALARRLGVDEEGLRATVERFNENARLGLDPDFHRGESAYDRYWTARGAAVLRDRDRLGRDRDEGRHRHRWGRPCAGPVRRRHPRTVRRRQHDRASDGTGVSGRGCDAWPRLHDGLPRRARVRRRGGHDGHGHLDFELGSGRRLANYDQVSTQNP